MVRAESAGEADEPGRRIAHVVVLDARPGVSPRPRERPGARPRAWPRSRPRPAEPEPAPTAPASGRATVISVRDPFEDEAAARAWLERAGELELEAGLDVLDRVLHAHRIATADPWLGPFARSRVTAGRIGYGAGEEVADGRWTAARELPDLAGASRAPRRRRRLAGSDARLAALLAGTEEPLACEELTLRTRLDLERGRPREAALQLLVALDAAIAELSAGEPGVALAERVTALRERRSSTAAAAQAALAAVPPPAAQADVAETLAMLEAALRARLAHRG